MTSSLPQIPKKFCACAYPTDTIKKLYETPFAERLNLSDKDPQMQAANDVAPFYFKQVDVDKERVSFDGRALEIVIKDDEILISMDGEVKKTMEYMDEEFQELIDFYLGRAKTRIDTLLVWRSPLFKFLPSVELTICLYVFENPDTEGWEFFKRCKGEVKFLNLLFEANPDIMKIPIIAGSLGIVFYGEQTNETLFESKHLYILHNKHVPRMEQLKDLIKFWKVSQRERGAICFDCSEAIYEEYKKEFESWPGSYTRRRIGILMRKELSIDFHSGKRIVIDGERIENSGKIRVIMAVTEKCPINKIINFVKVFWANPAAVKQQKGAEEVGNL